MNPTTWGLVTACAVSAATMGGVFFAFSNLVMKALGRLPEAHGVSAMQAINRAAPNPWFMVPLFGTGVVGTGLAVRAVGRLDEPGAAYELAGGAVYLVCVGLTVAYHVPRNDSLNRLDPHSVEATAEWATYLRDWTFANHARAVSAIAAGALWVLAVRDATPS